MNNVPTENFQTFVGPAAPAAENVAAMRRIMQQPPRAAVESDPAILALLYRWWKMVRVGNRTERAFAKGSISTAAFLMRETRPEIARELLDLAVMSLEIQS